MVSTRFITVLALSHCVMATLLPHRHLEEIDQEKANEVSRDVWQVSGLEGAPCHTLEKKKELAIAFVRKQMKSYNIPGIALSVVAENKTIISQGFGVKEYGNPKNIVTGSTMFEIGSYTKMFIALGIGKLVDEKRVSWKDPVKKHLPWFELVDKYAEKYTTIGDLLAMNSVIGDHEGDIAWVHGVGGSEKGLVKALASFNTKREFRAGYAYSNLNYEILGQIIEGITNQTWSSYLNTTFWQPLGMTNTAGRPKDVTIPNNLSFGHNTCDKKIAGPFNLLNSTVTTLTPDGYLAAGSILSSADDLSKLSHLLLSKGRGIFTSDDIVSTLTTGQSVSTFPQSYLPLMGYSYVPNGNALTAGYGFDFLGDVMFGQHFFGKSGDTFTFKTRSGFIPSKGLGVVVVANAQSEGGRFSSVFAVDLIRTYVMGIFLDIPTSTLDRQFNEVVTTADKSTLL